MSRAIAIAAVFLSHVALFTLVYFGRRQGVAACQPDMVLFGLLFLLASLAYAIPFASLFQAGGITRVLTGLLAVGAATASTVVGMFIAFNLMGT
jgi:hypothetical protein